LLRIKTTAKGEKMAKIIIEPLPKNDPIFKNSFLTYGKKPIKKDIKSKEVKCPLKK
jgi:hypothetical protein